MRIHFLFVARSSVNVGAIPTQRFIFISPFIFQDHHLFSYHSLFFHITIYLQKHYFHIAEALFLRVKMLSL